MPVSELTPYHRQAANSSAGLAVRGLTVTTSGGLRLIEGVDLDVRRGELLAVVGASGAGKSTLLKALLGRLPRDVEAQWDSATLETDGGPVDLTMADHRCWQALRRRHVRLVAQDPAAALTPLRRVDGLVIESLRLAGHKADRDAALEVLGRSGFAEPESLAERVTHELSGGMAQRVCVALALAARPVLLLADEPTTALDPEARDAVLGGLRAAADGGCAVVVVTHDLTAVSRFADRVIGLVAGRAGNPNPGGQVLAPLQRADASGGVAAGAVLELADLTLAYGHRVVVDRIGLSVSPGEVVGLRGPSGVGKSSLLHAVVGVVAPRGGTICVGSEDAATLTRRELRRRVQLVPQHPRESLNPWRTAEQLVREPLDIHRIGNRRGRRTIARDMLASLGLCDYLDVRPAQLSTGQCQRVCLARALVTRPQVLLADEPVSSLDPHLADEMLRLLVGAARRHGAGVLVVSHDHERLTRSCDRVVDLTKLSTH